MAALGACGGSGSSASSESTSTAPSITTQPQSATITSGSSTTLSVVASGSGTLSYQWYSGSAAVSGATAASYSVSAAGTYYVIVSNSAGSVTSSTATVTISATVTAPSITTQPSSTSVTSGSTGTFTVVASGTDLTYQWYSTSSGAISGATSASYSTSTLGSYYVIVSNTAGSVTSDTVTLSTSTNSGSDSVVTAANTFIASLTSTQQSSAVLGCTSAIAKKWTNLPVSISSRNGVQFSTLSSTQLAAANSLLAAAFSSSGVALIEQIRLGDEYIHLTNTSQSWGYDLYKLAILCTPSTSSMWMLQVTGHHLGYTLTFNGNATSATPVFIGTEPPNWTDSSSTTHAPLDTQRAAIQTLAQALQGDSSRASTAKLSGTFTDVTMGPSGSGDTNTLSYPTGTSGRGIAYSALTSSQQTMVKAVIEAYVNTVNSDIATALLTDYEGDTALASTYVGIGVGSSGTADFPASPSGLTTQHSYLRIDGPRVWIEFVVQQGVAFSTQVHYHSVWRDKTADYGAEF